MNPSKFDISISVESYDEKTVENDWNCYGAEKPIGSKLSKISKMSNQIHIAKIEDMNEDCVKIPRPYLI